MMAGVQPTALWDAAAVLVTRLRAAADDDDSPMAGWPVADGWPARGLEKRHVVVIGDTAEWLQNFGVSGLGAKDEQATIPVLVYLQRNVATYPEARAIARPVADEIIRQVQADHTLGGSVMLAQISRGQVEEGIVDEHLREVLVTLYVQCDAHLGAEPDG